MILVLFYFLGLPLIDGFLNVLHNLLMSLSNFDDFIYFLCKRSSRWV